MNPLFANPEYLLVGLLVVVLQGLLFIVAERRAWKRLRNFAQSNLLDRLTESHSRRKLWIKNALLMLTILFVFISLARPQWGANWEKAETRGIDIMIALDTSRSMLAEDISPNRLERSKLAILDLLDSVQGDRVGLIAFAGNAFLQCPLTLDYQAFRQTLSAIDTNTIPVGGTDVAAAIEEADAYFEQTDNERILILITDGEDLEASGLKRAREAAGKGTRILTVGVGSPDGELIPVRGPDGQMDFLRDASGKPVSTRLDDDTLRMIAEATDGLYAPLGPTGTGLERVYQFSLAQMPAQERQESLQRIPIERFQWPLLLAVIFLLVESMLTTRRRRPNTASLSALAIAALFLSSAFTVSQPAEAGLAREASKAFNDGRFEESVTLYKDALEEDPDSPDYIYNLGVAEYRAGSFDQAIAQFEKTLRVAEPDLQEKAFHNSGNSRVAYGFSLLEEEPAHSRDQWTAALTDYENALALDEGHDKSRQNLEQLRNTIEAHTFTLETIAKPIEGGTVSTGGRSFYNLPFEITAQAADGWIFNTWEGTGIEDVTKPATVVRLLADTTVTAQFVKTWELNVLSDDESMGTAATSGTYREDEPVTIKAEANDYFAFTKWKSEGVEIPDPSLAETEINLANDATVTAFFVPAFKLSVELDPEISGQAGPSGFFEEFSTVPLQAQPRPGFEWVGWIGDGIKEPGELETSITLTEDRVLVAKMKRIWNLVIIPTPEEGGTVEGAGNHPVGTTVDISATPAEGFTFEGWDGPGVEDSASPQTKVTVQSPQHTLFAKFQQDEQDNQDDQENEDQEENQDQNQDGQQDQDQEQDQEDSQDEESDSGEDEQEQEEEEESGEQDPQEEEVEEQEQESESDEPNESGEEEEEATPQPTQVGEMTREEARQLLNALSESEKFLPAGDRSQIDANAKPKDGRDW